MTAVHIHAPAPQEVVVQVKYRGGRKWISVATRRGNHTSVIHTSKRDAGIRLALEFGVRAARVVASYKYYDPSILWEATAR